MLLATDAIVLHAFDYSETSRILRLLTREAGVQSVLARGARRPKSRFGTALDLFAEGVAHLHLKPGRDLQTLSGFDVVHARPALGAALERFAGASALAELMLRFGTADEDTGTLFEAFAGALDGIVASTAAGASEATLAGAWHLVSTLGFAPTLDACSVCHTPLAEEEALCFHHAAGGVICRRCVRGHPGGRLLPAAARAAIAAWCAAERVSPLEPRSARAHQRLLREFLQQHLVDAGSLRAFDAWVHGDWSSA